MTDTWFNWGYLLMTLLQIVIVVLTVCVLGLIVNSAVYTMIQRWKSNKEEGGE